MTVKLWIDDLRSAPDGWLWAKDYDEAIALLTQHAGNISNIAFDHDLGEGKSGYDVACWMEANGVWSHYPPTVHSANPVGARRIWQVILRRYEGSAS